MKYEKFHKLIIENGWKEDPGRGKGSHIIYIKDGKYSPPIPFHGGKEIAGGLEKALRKEMGLLERKQRKRSGTT